LPLLAVGNGQTETITAKRAVAVGINLCFQFASFASFLLEKIEELRKNLRKLRLRESFAVGTIEPVLLLTA
jgi:hypothetical protein